MSVYASTLDPTTFTWASKAGSPEVSSINRPQTTPLPGGAGRYGSSPDSHKPSSTASPWEASSSATWAASSLGCSSTTTDSSSATTSSSLTTSSSAPSSSSASLSATT